MHANMHEAGAPAQLSAHAWAVRVSTHAAITVGIYANISGRRSFVTRGERAGLDTACTPSHDHRKELTNDQGLKLRRRLNLLSYMVTSTIELGEC